MSPGPRESPGTPSSTSLLGVVGWIFADLLLVLVVVFLATQTGGAVTRPPIAIPSESATPQPASPSPGPTPGVDSNFVCLRVNTEPTLLTGAPSAARDAHLADIERQVRERTSQPDLAGRRAGIVLSFGIADSPDDGVRRASMFNAEILPRVPPVFRRADGGPVANRAFWGGRPRGDRRSGAIEVNIYPIIDATHGPLTQPGPESC
jgi:hypothetical protein